MLRTTLLVAGKDLRQRLRDRSALVIAFVAPFALAATRLAVATALDASGRAPTAAEARRLGERAAAGRLPVQLADGRVGGRTIEVASYFGPSMAIFFLFFTVSFGARSILAERRQGTMRRLLATAAPPGGVLAGKALAAFALGTSSVLVMWLATTLVFGADWGDPEAALLLVTVFALVGTGVGMLLGSVLHNAEQATSIGPPVGIALGMLGGCMWPLAIVPEPMRIVGHLFPQAWAMDAFIALIAKDAGLAGITLNLAVLAAFAAALLTLATWLLRRALVG
jgi:ABC-2 type transport system permease protein